MLDESKNMSRIQAVTSAAERWKKDLMDLSGRNQLLYYRDLKSGTLDLTHDSALNPEEPAVDRLLRGDGVKLSSIFRDSGSREISVKKARTIASKARSSFDERGVKTLYIAFGMAIWDEKKSKATPASPVIMIPVEMQSRGTAGEDFEIKISGDAEVNSVLIHKINSDFRYSIDELEIAEPLYNSDFVEASKIVFEKIEKLVSDTVSGFSISSRIVLANFSYFKLPMVKDLERYLDEMSKNDLIAAIAGDSSAKDLIREMHKIEVDPSFPDSMPLVDEFLVLNADSTQNHAINRVVAGSSLVIKGPPGTGKSQTIANLIATLSARGKYILFVAEKRAAIDAVVKRLKQVGLLDLIMDLHGGSHSGKLVASNLQRSLEAVSSISEPDQAMIHSKLEVRRRSLSEYDTALHAIRDPWKVSIYQIQIELLKMKVESKSNFRFDDATLYKLSSEEFTAAEEELRRYLGLGGLPTSASVWAGSTARTAEDIQDILIAAQKVTESLKVLEALSEQACSDCGLRPPVSLLEIKSLCDLLAGTELTLSRFQQGIYEANPQQLAQSAAKTGFGVWFSGEAKSARSKAMSFALVIIPIDDIVSYLKSAAADLSTWKSLSVENNFPVAWGRTAELQNPYRAVSEGLQVLNQAFPTEDFMIKTAGSIRKITSELFENKDVGFRLPQVWSCIEFLVEAGLGSILEEIDYAYRYWTANGLVIHDTPRKNPNPLEPPSDGSGVEKWYPDPTGRYPDRWWDGSKWSRYVRDQLGGTKSEDSLENLMFEKKVATPMRSTSTLVLSPEETLEAFRWFWYKSIHEHEVRNDRRITGLPEKLHNDTVKEFSELDQRHIEESNHRVMRSWAECVIEARESFVSQAELVAKEAGKKSRHIPLRRLFQEASDVVMALKPCWVMSPLEVSQILPGERPYFDVVIFDEASQINPADSIPAILRGKQLVVAGDSKQLPPTSFFLGSNLEDETELDEYAELDNAITEGYESILDVCTTILPFGMLQWHYRSQDERLIAFSNSSFYDNSLMTFPSALGSQALAHIVAPSPSAGLNANESAIGETQLVVEAIFDHARRRPHETLGVIALGVKHSERITEALRLARLEDPSCESFFDENSEDPFFIKNLERVQGDERDTIIFSIGYGKRNSNGLLTYHFGPLLQENGERRLNVAVTRAKRRLTLVSSFTSNDIDPSRNDSRGITLLRNYLQYVESGGKNFGDRAVSSIPLNAFEIDVKERLTTAGIPLISQYGVSGYRIDFVAQHPKLLGLLVLAIECDGASYHSQPTARDRDRLRQEQLEQLGWTFHRIWSTDWFNNPEAETERALRAYNNAVRQSDEKKSNPKSVKEKPPLSEISMSPAAKRGSDLRVMPGKRTDLYKDSELLQVVKWVKSDTLLRTDDELLHAVLDKLGFKRGGNKINSRIMKAISRDR